MCVPFVCVLCVYEYVYVCMCACVCVHVYMCVFMIPVCMSCRQIRCNFYYLTGSQLALVGIPCASGPGQSSSSSQSTTSSRCVSY